MVDLDSYLRPASNLEALPSRVSLQENYLVCLIQLLAYLLASELKVTRRSTGTFDRYVEASSLAVTYIDTERGPTWKDRAMAWTHRQG